jgi:hypothetical protein
MPDLGDIIIIVIIIMARMSSVTDILSSIFPLLKTKAITLHSKLKFQSATLPELRVIFPV